jgi:hypothetical protein
MRNMIDLLPAMIEINGSKTASEDPNQRPESFNDMLEIFNQA